MIKIKNHQQIQLKARISDIIICCVHSSLYQNMEFPHLFTLTLIKSHQHEEQTYKQDTTKITSISWLFNDALSTASNAWQIS
jgi:hypothetical protein